MFMCSFSQAFQRYRAPGEGVGVGPIFVDPKMVVSIGNPRIELVLLLGPSSGAAMSGGSGQEQEGASVMPVATADSCTSFVP